MVVEKNLSYFINICSKLNLWYALDNYSLAWIAYGSPEKYDANKVCIMMNIDSFLKLQNNYPNNILDNYSNRKIKNIRAYFYDPNNVNNLYLEIRIIIPTTYKKIKKFFSPLRRLGLLLTGRSNNLRMAIDFLYSVNHDGYFLGSAHNMLKENNWTNVLNQKTITKKFMDINVNLPKNFSDISKRWFPNYEMVIEKLTDYEYVSPFEFYKRPKVGMKTVNENGQK